MTSAQPWVHATGKHLPATGNGPAARIAPVPAILTALQHARARAAKALRLLAASAELPAPTSSMEKHPDLLIRRAELIAFRAVSTALALITVAVMVVSGLQLAGVL